MLSIDERYSQCNLHQKTIIDVITSKRDLYVLHGAWGTGKTWTLQIIRDKLMQMSGENVLMAATTALAGILLDGTKECYIFLSFSLFCFLRNFFLMQG